MQIDVNGIKITLTKEQLQEIDKQIKNNKPIEERILTLEDLYKELNTTEEELLPYHKPTDKEQKSVNAYCILLKLAKVFNQGEILDFTKNTYKYIPYKYFSGGSAGAYVGVYGFYGSVGRPAGLFYKDKNLAETSLKNFRQVWDDYWMI